MSRDTPYAADRSLYGKLRRRVARLVTTKPARVDLERPLLTLSFDDAPVSAADTGAAVLERHGVHGTYFISAGLAGKDSHLGRYAARDEVARLAAAGHEIACHTFSHLDCGRARARDISAELDANLAALGAMGVRPSTFAYPYGDVSPWAKALINDRFLAGRALHHGMIVTGTDLNQAPGVGIEGADGERTARTWLNRAAAAKAWLVLYTHDVRENPSDWGCTPDVLERLVAAALDMGFGIVTFEQGARLAQGREAVKAA
jgi:peptidoglycan/xylan/chitin deacetylase (PgdA/CDA1 family)